MSAPRITDAAVEAGARGAFEVRDDPYDDDEWEDLDSTDRELYECQSRAALSAALPHIRRAVIEELAEKAEARMKALQEHRIIDGTPEADEWEAVARTCGWLRAELEGDDRG